MPARASHRRLLTAVSSRSRRASSGQLRWRRWLLWALALPWLTAALLIVLWRWLPPPTTAFMLQSPVKPVYYRWVDWPQIAPTLALAVISAEDQRFFLHHGFDFDAIGNALAEQHRRRGASTISQQVAKNLFLWPDGGYFRKGLEAGLTVLIETLLSKRRILEIYLNIAEFGRGVYGAEAAARRYFATGAGALTTQQAALLAAALPSPRRYNPAAPNSYHRRRAAWIETQMRRLGPAWLNALEAEAPQTHPPLSSGCTGKSRSQVQSQA